MHVLVCKPGEPPKHFEHTFSQPEPEYEELKKFFADNGLDGYFERVRIKHEYGGHTYVEMVVDEEGLIKGLPYNEEATKAYTRGSFNQPIVGPAIMFTEQVIY